MLDELHRAAPASVDTEVIRPMKVVVDGGNGMAGPMIGPILRALPLELVEIFEPDGEFPRPRTQTPVAGEPPLHHRARAGADLGIAWDGDADRCFFFDDEGEFVPGDFITPPPAAPPARHTVRPSRANR